MRVTQSGCFEPGYFWSNWTGLVVFSMLTEGWPTVWPESPDSIVVGCYGVYSLTAWYPLRKLYDQGTLSFHAPPFFCKDFHFRLLIFLSCFSFFFFSPTAFSTFFFFFFYSLCTLSFQNHWRCLQPTLQDQDPGSEHNIKVMKRNDFTRQRQKRGNLMIFCRLNVGEQHSSGAATEARKAGGNIRASSRGQKS